MRRLSQSIAIFAATIVALTGCETTEITDGGPDGSLTDAGRDATVIRRDSGPIIITDAGPGPVDAGPGDAGPGLVDAGPTDAGPTPTDAGPTPTDAGPTPTDAGPAPTDAGPAPTDAGPAPTDAGPAPTDAGPAPTDAGPPAGCFDVDLGMSTAVVTGTTAGMGNDTAPSGGCSTGSGGADISYRFTAPSAGRYVFDTIDSADPDADTVLYIQDASCSGELVCQDDANPGLDIYTSRVAIDLTAGQTIVLVVDVWNAAAEGAFTLTISQGIPDTETMCGDSTDEDRDGAVDCLDSDCGSAASCDSCIDDTMTPVTTLGAGPEATGDTTAESDNRIMTSCFTFSGGSDEAFAFTAPSAGYYQFDAAGTGWGPVLYLLDSDCSGSEVACNNAVPASLVHYMAAGETVVVVVDGFDETEFGPWEVDITSVSAPALPTTLGEVFINEVMPNPAGADPATEWFELMNVTGSPLLITGCTLADNPGSHPVAGNVVANPFETITFAASGTTGFDADYVYSTLSLANGAGGDRIVLTCGGTEIDRVEFTSSFPFSNGNSMQLDTTWDPTPGSGDEPHVMNDSAVNYCETASAFIPFNGVDRGTPGQHNFCL